MAFNGDANGGPPGRKTRPREGLHLRPLNVEKGAKRVREPRLGRNRPILSCYSSPLTLLISTLRESHTDRNFSSTE